MTDKESAELITNIDAAAKDRGIVEFSRFLAVLAKDFNETSAENIKLQQKITNLTWGLFWLTAVLLIIALIQTFFLIFPKSL